MYDIIPGEKSLRSRMNADNTQNDDITGPVGNTNVSDILNAVVNPCPIERSEILNAAVNSCPTGPTGPPGLQGSKGTPGRVDNDIIFDRLSLLVAPLGSDTDYQFGNINKPCRTIQTAVNAVPDGGTVHIIPGTYASFTCPVRNNFSIRGWGEVDITGTCIVTAGTNVILERVNFPDALIVTNGSCTIRSCTISTLTASNMPDLQVRGCTFTAGTLTTYIAATNVTKCLIQSCLFIGFGVSSVISGSGTAFIFRDNLVRWNGVSILADNISNFQGRIMISHNGIHVMSADSVIPATGSLFNAKVHHNSFHNLSDIVVPYVTDGKLFNNSLRMSYTNPGLRVGNFNKGKLMTAHTRSVRTVESGIYNMTGDVTVVYVSGPDVSILLPPPIDGLIIEISVAPAATSCTVGSTDTIDLPPWGDPQVGAILAPSTFVRLQWFSSRSTWIGSVGTITVP